jgi:hypothetical protein
VNQPIPTSEMYARDRQHPLRIRRSRCCRSADGLGHRRHTVCGCDAWTQFAVRIMGSTGRLRVLRFDTAAGTWQP